MPFFGLGAHKRDPSRLFSIKAVKGLAGNVPAPWLADVFVATESDLHFVSNIMVCMGKNIFFHKVQS